jgi:hypothetical protein
MYAHSPQVKGRVEQFSGTDQYRLITELQERAASTIDEANQLNKIFFLDQHEINSTKLT